eukprot:TRINITY_DN7117_c0_g2_i1.p1 TRINITY_DN7117_c0_g2~~TRINITY_DN7117_c0_g2_i1.p1  ORF type:complete len:534 (+),score=85.49 TRINITY_DN7117_c0_g2_i1:89-1690(+)
MADSAQASALAELGPPPLPPPFSESSPSVPLSPRSRPPPLHPSQIEDFAGELQRKIPRMQAISAVHSLSTWQREWCVVSHNFVIFFASRTNLVVNKCVLLSAVLSSDVDKDGRGFRVSLLEEEVLCLRVPDVAKSGPSQKEARSVEAKRWVEEVRRRAKIAADSGEKIMPCITLSEAQRLKDDLDRQLSDAERRQALDARRLLIERRQRTLAIAIRSLLLKNHRGALRDAFEELALHSRLCMVHAAKRRAAARRLGRALGRPEARLLRDSFSELVVYWGSPAAVWRSERYKAARKRIFLGVTLLASCLPDIERRSLRLALSQLCRHVECARRAETTAAAAAAEAALEAKAASSELLEGRSSDSSVRLYAPPSRSAVTSPPTAIVAQRLRLGGHLLRVVVRNLIASRFEWAFGTLAIHAARFAEAGAIALARSTDELNEEIFERCQRAPVDEALVSLSFAIRAAQNRQLLFAIFKWSAAFRGKGCSARDDGAANSADRSPLPPAPSPPMCTNVPTPPRLVSGSHDFVNGIEPPR